MERLPENMRESIQDWREGKASLDQIRAFATRIGELHYEEGIPSLLELLHHADAIVRYNAVMSLAFDLHYTAATNALLSRLAYDKDEDVRSVAAGGLGVLWQGTKDVEAIQGLARAALTDSDEDVRTSAYKSLLIIYGLPAAEHLQLLRSDNLRVDPIRLQSILKEVS